MFKFRTVVFLFMMSSSINAQLLDHSWSQLVTSEDSNWYGTKEAKRIADNVLLYQRDIGGWPKNIAMQTPLSAPEKEKLMELKPDPKGCTIDNGATFLEMTYLTKIYRYFPEEKYKTAFVKGLNYLLEAQYANGGWPQFYPPVKGYYTHITYNDDAMTNVLFLLKSIIEQQQVLYKELDSNYINASKAAFDMGIACILKTQYVQNGVLTAWCAQYDESTLQPAKARAYELPSLSGKESAKIVLLLMSIKDPSPDVINAVNGALTWFEKVKITGIRQERTFNDKGRVIRKRIVPDTKASPLWARFMELDTNRPFFCDRDGIKKYALSEIGEERRNGYAWYTDEPQEVLNKYPLWKAQNVKKTVEKTHKNEFHLTVAQDGTGDYTSVQEAIYNCKAFPYDRITIFVKSGIYREKVRVPEWNPNISLIGENTENTIITFDDYFGKTSLGRNSTFYTYTVLVEGDNFHAENLTIENTAGPVGQAVALSIFADKVSIKNCKILGNQDTLYTSGDGNRQYFKDCYIEGTTDFIFGSATAYFENCDIYSKADSYITAASTPKDTAFGFVFDRCKLQASQQATKVFLGRPWRIYAKTVFINCEMGDHIVPAGWNNWNKPEAEKTAFYAEYRSVGKGANAAMRVGWSHQLTKRQALKYTRENILGKEKWYEEQ